MAFKTVDIALSGRETLEKIDERLKDKLINLYFQFSGFESAEDVMSSFFDSLNENGDEAICCELFKEIAEGLRLRNYIAKEFGVNG